MMKTLCTLVVAAALAGASALSLAATDVNTKQPATATVEQLRLASTASAYYYPTVCGYRDRRGRLVWKCGGKT